MFGRMALLGLALACWREALGAAKPSATLASTASQQTKIGLRWGGGGNS
jgi:hypothetical protein